MVSHYRASRLADGTWLQLEAITSGRATLAVRVRSSRRSCYRQRHSDMSVWTDSELLAEGTSDRSHHASPFVAAAGASLRTRTLGAFSLALGQSREPIPAESEFDRSLE